jgi:cytoskeletal protein CcmA (bactofilin family)
MNGKRQQDVSFDQPETVVGASVKIEGDLNSEGDIRIEGFVVGKVATAKNVYVGERAKIDAEVSADNIIIGGIVNGNIRSDGLVSLMPTGKVIGNITCKRLSIQEGAYFEGQCKMEKEKETINEPIPEKK